MPNHQPATPERQPADDFERRYGRFGGRELRQLPFTVAEVRDSGAGDGQYTITGHAAVFDQWSLDLGFFRERILPGAFDEVLSASPDVWHLWDHDTRYVLSRTTNKTLELKLEPEGLRFWSRVAQTGYAKDLRALMERGDVDQSSFAFTVEEDEWRIITDAAGDETIERDIIKVGALYDVTTTAMGAYPQTDSKVARARITEFFTEQNRIAQDDPAGAENAAQVDPADDAASRKAGEGSGAPSLATLRAKGRRARLLHLSS